MKQLFSLFSCILLTCCIQQGQARSRSMAHPKQIGEKNQSQNIYHAISLLHHNYLFEAKLLLKSALYHAPNSALANSAMGYYYTEAGEALRAEQYFNQSLALASKDPRILFNYGAFLCNTNQKEDGLAFIHKALALNHHHRIKNFFKNVGDCQGRFSTQKKRITVALKKHKKAIRKNINKKTIRQHAFKAPDKKPKKIPTSSNKPNKKATDKTNFYVKIDSKNTHLHIFSPVNPVKSVNTVTRAPLTPTHVRHKKKQTIATPPKKPPVIHTASKAHQKRLPTTTLKIKPKQNLKIVRKTPAPSHPKKPSTLLKIAKNSIHAHKIIKMLSKQPFHLSTLL
jgi:Tfp pilus assembly protein PilF